LVIYRGGTVTDWSFPHGAFYPLGSGSRFVAIGDLDGDGWPDAAVTNYGSGNVSVLKNMGDGTFDAQVTYGTDTQPWDLAMADLNGDGKADLAVANDAAASNLAVFLNNGDGTFAPRVSYPAGAHAHALAVGDLNGDGNPDVAVAAETDDAFSVYLNRGDGTFTRQPVVPAGGSRPASVALADIDGDGKMDVIVASSVVKAVTNTDTLRTVTVFPGNGAGGFGVPDVISWTSTYTDQGSNRCWQLVAADLNGDGRPDLAVAAGDARGTVLLNACTP
ncbi:MAG TPA: VCBS repeat-containing protein, partial [Polyangia bacterium]|nr:VCBS repeat-containing protein [Polyangia bacterium]